MWNDIIDLRAFYTEPLGRLARRLIARRLRQLWPDMRGHRLLGVGFPPPYLSMFQGDAERVLAAMPSGQGVMHWPEGAPNLAVLTDEQTLPFPDRAFDRLLLIHCLEGSAQIRPLMRECWRVLADGGRLLVVVANRRSLWARAESTPFAQGRPYSMGQITRLVRDNMFVPVQAATALFVPPFWSGLFRGWANGFDNLGARWFPTFGGVVMVEAEKQIYAMPHDMAPARRRSVKVAVKTASNGAAYAPVAGSSINNGAVYAPGNPNASGQTTPVR